MLRSNIFIKNSQYETHRTKDKEFPLSLDFRKNTQFLMRISRWRFRIITWFTIKKCTTNYIFFLKIFW